MMNREEDLSKVFDRRWTANHNDDVKKAREEEHKFMDKMFNTKPREEKKVEVITPEMKVQNLQNNMTSANNFQKRVNLNNIKGRLK